MDANSQLESNPQFPSADVESRPGKLYRDRDLCKEWGISRSNFWKLVAGGVIPRGKKIGPRCTRWTEEMRASGYHALISGKAAK